MRDNDLYIACIDLTDRRCLVVGGGPIALEKIEGLLAAGANVKVVALQPVPEVGRLAAEGAISLHARAYEPSDLDDCFLVVAATSDREVNTAVHSDAEARSMLVNVADVPDLCNFILPAVARNGPLAIAVSTLGTSPALAQRMRREASERFDAAYVRLAELLEAERPWAKQTLPTYQDRKAFFSDIVNGEPDPIPLLRAGQDSTVTALIDRAKRKHSSRVQTTP